jgi:transcriptional regulator with XRE-family HTH domain
LAAYFGVIGGNAMPQINPIALKSLRTRRNWSLDELATEAKVDRGTINKIETGKRANPRGSTVRKIANALGVEPDDLASTDIEPSRVFRRLLFVRRSHDECYEEQVFA